MQRYNKISVVGQKKSLNIINIAFLISLGYFLATTSASAQTNPTVQLRQEQGTIAQVIDRVGQQTGFRFAYNTDFDTSRTIIVPGAEATLSQIMDIMVLGTDWTYIVQDKNVVIRRTKIEPVPGVAVEVEEPRFGISGTIIDSQTRKPISGATLSIRGARYSQRTTESSGSFTFTNLAKGSYTIIITAPNYRTETITQKISTSNARRQVALKPMPAELSYEKVQPSIALELASPTTIATPEPAQASAPAAPKNLALKTNLLLWSTTSPNIGAELRLSKKMTLDLGVSYNPWKFSDNKLFRHILIQPELRYWNRESFSGHFFGANLAYAFFNVGGVKLPFGLIPSMEQERYEGNLYSIGVSWGYHKRLTNRISAEVTAGIGYAHLDYNKFPCQECGRKIAHENKNYFGPTKLGISVIYILK